jgi:hypothetical protein
MQLMHNWIKSARHFYLGSDFVGPHESLLKLTQKNILFPRVFRRSSYGEKVAARKADYAWKAHYHARLSGLAQSLRQSGEICMGENRPSSQFCDQFYYIALREIYTVVGAHLLLKNKEGDALIKNEDISLILSHAISLINTITDQDIKSVLKSRHYAVVRSVEAGRSFSFCYAIKRIYASDDPMLTAFFRDSDTLIFPCILSASSAEQSLLFELCELNDDAIISLYFEAGLGLISQEVRERLECDVLYAHTQFMDFVQKGKELGIFDGWADDPKLTLRTNIVPNLANPLVADYIARIQNFSRGQKV